MDMLADELLRTYSRTSLQQMAKILGISGVTKKDKLVTTLAKRIYDSHRVEAIYGALAPVERRLVDLLILMGGEAPTALIRQHLEHEGRIDASAKPDRSDSYYGFGFSSSAYTQRGTLHTRDSRKFEDVVTRLGASGLVFTAEPIGSYGTMLEFATPGRRLFIPGQILKSLPSVELKIEPTATPETEERGDPAPLLRDVYLLLSFAAREPIPLTARGMIPKRTVARIAESLQVSEWSAAVRTEDDLTRLTFLRGITEEIGLLFASAGNLALDESVETFLRLPANERQERLFAAWRGTTRWNELFRLPDVGVKGKGLSIRAAPPGIVDARERVLREMAELPVNEWIDPRDFTDQLRLRAYEFLLPRNQAHDYYYYRYYGTNSLPNPYPGPNHLGMTFDVPDEQAGWNLVEAEFAMAILAYPLSWLGVVDLGEANGSASAFRITPDGAKLLRGESPEARPSQTQVIVQPNYEILVMEPTGEDVLFRLDQMAELRSADRATTYELTRDSIYRAQRAGFETSEIVGFLESISSVELPPNVRRTIEEWGAQTERVTLRRRTPLLQATDEKTLDELYADEKISRLLGRRLTATVALVPAAGLRHLAEQLVERGQLPALSEGREDAPTPMLAAGDDCELTFRQRVPSIYDLRTLRRFADDSDGGVRMTRESLRRGAKEGLAADDIVAELQRLHAGPLPTETAAMVRRWAKDWGAGAIVDATILQVDQPETLADLFEDPELRSSLAAVPGAPTIALVRAQSVKRVRKLLEERGMSLGDRLIR